MGRTTMLETITWERTQMDCTQARYNLAFDSCQPVLSVAWRPRPDGGRVGGGKSHASIISSLSGGLGQLDSLNSSDSSRPLSRNVSRRVGFASLLAAGRDMMVRVFHLEEQSLGVYP